MKVNCAAVPFLVSSLIFDFRFLVVPLLFGGGAIVKIGQMSLQGSKICKSHNSSGRMEQKTQSIVHGQERSFLSGQDLQLCSKSKNR